MSLAQFAAQELARQARLESVNRGPLKIPAPRKASESIYCPLCRDRGRAIAGTVFVDGKMFCSDHAQQSASPERKASMAARRDWTAIDVDILDSDKSVAEIARSHCISSSDVYNRRYQLKRRNGGAKKAKKAGRRAKKTTNAPNKAFPHTAVLEDLRRRRALLDRAITAFEDLELEHLRQVND